MKNDIKTYFYDNGTIMEQGPMVDFQRHGEWTSYYPDGTKYMVQSWVNGVNHGKYTVYNKDGSVREEEVIFTSFLGLENNQDDKKEVQ